jgi:hypothetical protein
MPEQTHIIAGRCTTVFEETREQGGAATENRTDVGRKQEQHGDMIVLVKPDSTSKLLVDCISHSSDRDLFPSTRSVEVGQIDRILCGEVHRIMRME